MEEILTHILGELAPHQVEGLDLDARYLADLGYREITRFSGLTDFTVLEELSLTGQQITSWAGLPPLPNLSILHLSDNELSDFHQAPSLTALTDLDLSLNMLTSLHGIPDWPALRHLNLAHNQIRSLEGLQHLPLNSLVLSGNRSLRQLSDLAVQSQLESLFAMGLLIPDWAWVADSRIKSLAFTPTSTSAFSSLRSSRLTELTLSLKKCQGNLSLEPLPSLRKISLTKGPFVTDILLPEAPIAHLSITHSELKTPPLIPDPKHLVYLDLRHNYLTDLPTLSSFPRLKDVFLTGNPLSSKMIQRIELHPEINWHL